MTVNVAAFRLNTDGTSIQALADSTCSGITVSGSSKLTQRVLTQLMTVNGSIPYAPNQGCSFISTLQVNGMASESDIFTAWGAAQIQLRPNLNLEESSSDPLDEKFQQAILNQIVITDELVTLDITIVSQANSAANVKLPLNFQLQ
jgi:hypothetical protein